MHSYIELGATFVLVNFGLLILSVVVILIKETFWG